MHLEQKVQKFFPSWNSHKTHVTHLEHFSSLPRKKYSMQNPQRGVTQIWKKLLTNISLCYRQHSLVLSPLLQLCDDSIFPHEKKSHNGNIFIRKTSFFTKKTKIDWNQNSLQSWKLCGLIEIFEAKYGWILGVNEAWKVMKVAIAKNEKVSRNGHKVDLKLRLTKIENRV